MAYVLPPRGYEWTRLRDGDVWCGVGAHGDLGEAVSEKERKCGWNNFFSAADVHDLED